MLIEQLTVLAQSAAQDRSIYRRLQKACAGIMMGVMDLAATGRHYCQGSEERVRLERSFEKLRAIAEVQGVLLVGFSAQTFAEDLRRELGLLRGAIPPPLHRVLFSCYLIGAKRKRMRGILLKGKNP